MLLQVESLRLNHDVNKYRKGRAPIIKRSTGIEVHDDRRTRRRRTRRDAEQDHIGDDDELYTYTVIIADSQYTIQAASPMDACEAALIEKIKYEQSRPVTYKEGRVICPDGTRITIDLNTLLPRIEDS